MLNFPASVPDAVTLNLIQGLMLLERRASITLSNTPGGEEMTGCYGQGKDDVCKIR